MLLILNSTEYELMVVLELMTVVIVRTFLQQQNEKSVCWCWMIAVVVEYVVVVG